MRRQHISYSFDELEDYEAALNALGQKIAAGLTIEECYALLRSPPKLIRKSSPAYKQICPVIAAAGVAGARQEVMINARVLRAAVVARLRPTFKFRFIMGIHWFLGSGFFSVIQGLFGYVEPVFQRHSDLIGIMRKTKMYDDFEGKCYGISSTAVLANAVGELRHFDDRLNKMYSSNYEIFSRLGRFNQGRDNNYNKLSEEEADTLAMFHTVEILQRPYRYRNLFEPGKTIHQNLLTTYKVAAPAKLTKDLSRIEVSCGAYDQKWLEKYFEKMRNTIFKDDKSSRVTVQLSSGSHAIAVTYDFEKSAWRLINSAASELVSEQAIARKVILAFGRGTTIDNSSHAVFMANIYGTEDDINQIRSEADALRKWNDSYLRSRWKTVNQMWISGGISLVYTAAYYGRLDVLNLIGKDKSTLNRSTDDGYTPLHVAMTYERVDAVRLLVENGAKFSAAELIWAIGKRNTDLVKVFLERDEIDIDRPVSLSKSDLIKHVQDRIPQVKLDEFKKKHRFSFRVRMTLHELAEFLELKETADLIKAKSDERQAKLHRRVPTI